MPVRGAMQASATTTCARAGGRTSPTSPAIHRPMVLCMHGRAQGVTKAAFVGKGRDLRGAVRRRFFEVRSGFMRFGLPAARVPSR